MRQQLPAWSRYELLAKIASGASATVYVGRERAAATSPLVAIKRAHRQVLVDPSWRARLVEEAHLASRIRHPNVVSIDDVEDGDGELILVMEYVEGVSLGALLARAADAELPIAAPVAVRVVLDVAAGLAAAHATTGEDGVALGVVHRDVTPHNILVGLDGVARISDFGIARVEHGARIHSSSALLRGNVGYMAPEYVTGGQLDERADVYGLAVVAWELFSGRRLHHAASQAIVLLQVADEPAPDLEAVAGVEPAVAAVIARGLHKSPAARYPTMAAFAADLAESAAAAGLLGERAEVAAVVDGLAGDAIRRLRSTLHECAESAPPALEGAADALDNAVVTSATTDYPPRAGRVVPAVFLLAAAGLLAITMAIGPIESRVRPSVAVASAGLVPKVRPLPPPATSSKPSPSAAAPTHSRTPSK